MRRDRRDRGIFAGLLSLTLLLAASPGHAVDGVIEINQAKANAGGVTPGDAPGLPVTISTGTFASEPMSFRLTGPLITSTSGNVIEIQSPHVTLDLNGFAVTCLLVSCNGNAIQSSQANVTVKNGTVRNFAAGVQVTGDGAHIENVHALNNTGNGIEAGNNCLVANNIATGNGVEGIRVQAGCQVSGNVADANSSDGIATGQGCNVSENTVRGNAGFGLNLAANTGFGRNVISANTGGAFSLGVSTGGNLCNGSVACP